MCMCNLSLKLDKSRMVTEEKKMPHTDATTGEKRQNESSR